MSNPFNKPTKNKQIPGQYATGGGAALTSPPRPELHTRVAAVDPVVLTLASKQRPKRLVLVGDDERSYGFLVKGGEDVRGDERIEQLFEAMNAVMAQGALLSAHT